MNWDASARTSDFGADGYTTSVTDFWHEMLQMTAPDAQCGVVFVRGDFPDDPGAILARAQSFDQHRSWGLRVCTKLDGIGKTPYTLGSVTVQGLINHKWPYSQYELKMKGRDPGIYSICSFVKDATVYQVARLKVGAATKKEGTGIQSQPLGGHSVSRRSSITSSPPKTLPPVPFRLGGNMRFGCSCSIGKFQADDYKSSTSADEFQHACESSRYAQKLVMQLFSNGENVAIKKDMSNSAQPDLFNSDIEAPENRQSWKKKWSHTSIRHEATVKSDDATVVIAAFRLQPVSDDLSLKPIKSSEIEEYLGAGEGSIRATKRLWDACKTSNNEAVGFDDVTAIARAVEYVKNVASVPVLSILLEEHRKSSPANAENSEMSPASVSEGKNRTDENFLSDFQKAAPDNPTMQDSTQAAIDVDTCVNLHRREQDGLEDSRTVLLHDFDEPLQSQPKSIKLITETMGAEDGQVPLPDSPVSDTEHSESSEQVFVEYQHTFRVTLLCNIITTLDVNLQSIL